MSDRLSTLEILPRRFVRRVSVADRDPSCELGAFWGRQPDNLIATRGCAMTATATDGQSTVYVVDDDAELCQSLEWLIHSVGLRARVYSSAKEFLKHVEPVPSGCLVLDVRMPGMSGIELQEQLHQQGIDLPIILLTGYAEVPLVVRAMHAGAFDVIQKPFSHQALLDRIHDALAKNA